MESPGGVCAFTTLTAGIAVMARAKRTSTELAPMRLDGTVHLPLYEKPKRICVPFDMTIQVCARPVLEGEMPKGPKGEKRPADVNARAVMIGRIATGEVEDTVPSPEDEGKNPAAVALGRLGGKARADKLSPRKRKAIAKKAASARWTQE